MKNLDFYLSLSIAERLELLKLANDAYKANKYAVSVEYQLEYFTNLLKTGGN
ncbi:MAG: hypothetical protein IM526_02980 [Microcystis sp. M38BS1]|uniref:hypothetical protein n=1 Tax=Microcystis sp. M38BS1 TaxID=2771188 RepID=UPI0031FDAB56|nr:hypothetical protein [Microcystis sp. M38BS1]MCA6582627.1 hypothetical protein [Pseudanabaena sp. M34BS1SP1A06MG]